MTFRNDYDDAKQSSELLAISCGTGANFRENRISRKGAREDFGEGRYGGFGGGAPGRFWGKGAREAFG